MKPVIRRFRYRIEYAGFLAVGWVSRALPLEIASLTSGKLWRLIAPLTRRHERAVSNLQHAFPEFDRKTCDSIARRMWEALGRNFIESFRLDEIAASDRLSAEPGAFAMMQEFSRSGKGCVICAAHQANWEVMGIMALRAGLRPMGIYQRIKNPFVDARVRAMRARFYPAGLLPKGRQSSVSMMRHVQRGGAMALLADLRDYRGVQVPFFGRQAPTTTFPAQVARALGVPLFAWHSVREPGVRFRLWGEEISVPITEDRDADVALATARLQAAFERSIRQQPEQWMWAHRRWG